MRILYNMMHHRRIRQWSVGKRQTASASPPEHSDHDHPLDDTDEMRGYKGACLLLGRYCFSSFLASCNYFCSIEQQRRRLLRALLPCIILILLQYVYYPIITRSYLSDSYLEPLPPQSPDYGGLEIASLRDAPQFSRQISLDNDLAFEKYRETLLMDELDDTEENDNELANQKCRQPDWASRFFPNCNTMHETDFSADLQAESDCNSYLIDCGQYRDTWVVNSASSQDMFVVKSLRTIHDLSIKSIHQILPDAIVMERLTSSPRIVNIYGLCGTSVSVEYMPYIVYDSVIPEDKPKNQSAGVCTLGLGPTKEEAPMDILLQMPNEPRNNLTSAKKLEMALEMAASIADLHGFPDGVIVHCDIQLRQWLRQSTPDGKLKLGDFNLAQVLSWNDEKKEYCKFKRGRGLGNYRAPEEIRRAGHLTEKLDVFSFCNIIYALLTGQRVILDYFADATWQERKIANYTSFIRRVYRHGGHAEEKLVDLLERCWEPESSKRIDIFEIVQFLRDAIQDNQNRSLEATDQIGEESKEKRRIIA